MSGAASMSADRPESRLTIEGALERLGRAGDPTWITLFEHGSLEIEIYRPRGVDAQTPHDQDEVYVVIAGKGDFVVDGRRQPFEPGEVLFVRANVPHRFENFSADFATWVVFYGPKGGES
jgi:mannose-6-phosphate isomerase-like protein (cupin superfamily)